VATHAMTNNRKTRRMRRAALTLEL